MRKTNLRAALLAGAIAMLPGAVLAQEAAAPAAEAAVEKPLPRPEAPTVQTVPAAEAEPAVEPKWEAGLIVTAHPLEGNDLLTVSKEVYADGKSTATQWRYTDFLKDFPAQKPHAPSGMLRKGFLNVKEAGTFVPTIRLTPAVAKFPTVCGIRTSVAGENAIYSPNVFLPAGDGNTVTVQGRPLTLESGPNEIEVWSACAPANPETKSPITIGGWQNPGEYSRYLGFDVSEDNIMREDNSRSGHIRPVEAMLGVGIELLMSDSAGQGALRLPADGLVYDANDIKTTRGVLGAVSVAPVGGGPDFAKGEQSGWVVSGGRYDDYRSVVPGNDWTLFRRGSTFSIRDHVDAGVGEPRPYSYTAYSTFYAAESGQWLFAVVAQRMGTLGLVACTAKMDMDVVGTVFNATDLTGLDGTGVVMGSANLKAGGRGVVLSMACNTSDDRKAGLHNLPTGLLLNRDGTFSSQESGIMVRVLVKGPSDAVLRAPKPEEFFALPPAGAKIIGVAPSVSKKVGPVKVNVPVAPVTPAAPAAPANGGATSAAAISAALAQANASVNLTVNFKTGSAELTPAGREQVSNLANALQSLKGVNVLIEGHTDNVGRPASNQTLSERRAAAMVQELVDMGVAKDRLTSKGFGQTKPIAENDSEDGRAKNRRVTVRRID